MKLDQQQYQHARGLLMQEWIQMLHEAGFEAKLVGDSILGGSRPKANIGGFNKISLSNVFVIYKEGDYWLADMSGVGQVAIIIRRSFELDEAVKSVVNYSKLQRHLKDEFLLINVIFRLQKNGFIAEVRSETDIHIFCTETAHVDNISDFMLHYSDKELLGSSCEFIIRWSQKKDAWSILARKPNEIYNEQPLVNFEEAVDSICSLRSQ